MVEGLAGRNRASSLRFLAVNSGRRRPEGCSPEAARREGRFLSLSLIKPGGYERATTDARGQVVIVWSDFGVALIGMTFDPASRAAPLAL